MSYSTIFDGTDQLIAPGRAYAWPMGRAWHALTRVLLPLTVGFNVLLAREERPSRFWPLFATGNLHLVASLWVMPVLF